MELQKFMSVVFEAYNGVVDRDITDRIFCMIENDRTLLNHYLDLLAESPARELRYFNSQIAQAIARHYGLTNNDIECSSKSKLIQAYHQLV